MAHRFTRRFRVRHSELDALGQVNASAYARYMQEAAIEASADVGFDSAWYRDRGTGWVVRRLTVRVLARAAYGEEVAAATWVSRMRGVRSTREYDITRAGDGTPLARGQAEWVYLDRSTGQPTRFPAEFLQAFAAGGDSEDLEIRLDNAQPTPGSRRHSSRRRVQFHELDPARHVNHAAYLDWVGQATWDALRDAGHPLERLLPEGVVMLPAGHDIEYLAPARADDPITVVSWVCEMGEQQAAWSHEVRNADTDELLARDHAVWAIVGSEGSAGPTVGQLLQNLISSLTG
jgi:acyl-CoA thioester hydrolase